MAEFEKFIEENGFVRIGGTNGYRKLLGMFEIKVFDNQNNNSYSIQARTIFAGFPFYHYKEKRIFSVEDLRDKFTKQVDKIENTAWR